MEAVWAMVMVSVPLGHPVAWDLCQRQTRQILFDNIFAQSVLFLLMEVNGFVMTATRSVSISSLGIFSGARLVRLPNCEVVPVDVEGMVEGVFADVEDDVEEVERWGVEKLWKLRMMGTRPAFRMRWALRSSVADIIMSRSEGMVSRAKMASWMVLLRWPR